MNPPLENDDHLPIIKSFFDPQALGQRISEAYALSNVRCQLIKATMRDVYYVQSSQGDFAGFVYRANYSRESIAEEIKVMDYLASQGFAAASVVRQPDGEDVLTLRAPEGPRYAVLQPYVHGTFSRQPDSQTVRRYGALVAQFHLLTEAMPSPQYRPTYDQETLIALPMKILEATIGHIRTLFDALQLIADDVYHLLEALPRSNSQFGIVHGDVIPSNALITPPDMLTLIDFDLFGVGWRTYDLACYLNEIYFWQMGQSAADVFLAGYQSLRPLGRDELQTLPLMRLARRIFSLSAAVMNVNTWGSAIYLSDKIVDAAIDNIRELYLDLRKTA